MMTSRLWLFTKRLKRSLLTRCVLSLWLAVTPVALAEYTPPPDLSSPRGRTVSSASRVVEYTPPREPSSPGRGTAGGLGGTRGGCENSQGSSLTVLAPLQHVGQTVSTRPTFAWFIPDTKPFPLEFSLFELTENNQFKLVQKLEAVTSPGIMKLSLPKDQPGLVVGRTYLWQVAVICDPNHPSTALVARAEIEVVEMPSTLNLALSGTTDSSERANLYAEAGLWYDALREALLAAPNSRLGETALTLLESLAKLEDSQHRANLSQVASSQQ